MSKARASIFEEEERARSSISAVLPPKPPSTPKRLQPEQVRAVAQAAKFRSREATRAEARRKPNVLPAGTAPGAMSSSTSRP